ncbi:MAG: flagellar basal body P-ring formation chaperone FlgA [Pseudomonadota bacterium]
MNLKPLALLLLAPLAAPAGDGVAAALQAAAAVWPAAKITASIADAPCAAPAVADTPASARNGVAQVRVRCTGTPGWTRYIALNIEQTAMVAVLRAALAPGQALSAAGIEWQPRDAMKLPADVLLQSAAELPALTARRNLPAGSVLARSQFSAPKTIQRGQAVTLISRAAGMEVRAPGEALADAALGARVKVRNSASRRVVEGIAIGDGTVEVRL